MKNLFKKFIVTVSFLLICFSFSNCMSMFASFLKPDPAVAVDPPGFTVDPANAAYLGGPIRAIGTYDFDEGQGAMKEYQNRSVRVPSGIALSVLVHYHFQSSMGEWWGFKYVSLPPLEKGVSYILFFDGAALTGVPRDGNIRFQRVNPDSGKLETINGATIAN